MKVTIERLNLLRNVINDANRLVKIYWNDVDENGDISTVTFEVNWGCLGGTSTKEAREFAQTLVYVSSLVDLLNSLQIEVDYNGGDAILANKQSFKEWYSILQNNLTYNKLIDYLTM